MNACVNSRSRPLRGAAAAVLLVSFSVATATAGEYGGSFLRLPAGADALGTGGAFTAVVDGAAAVWWNPARLARGGSGPSFMMELVDRSLDRRQSLAGYYRPLPGGAGMGLAWINGTVGEIDGRDRNGDPTGSFSGSENSFAFAFGLAPHPAFRTGLAVKTFYHRLADQGRATGFGLDLGMDLDLGRFLTASLAVQDISARVNWDTGDLWGDGLEGQMDKVDRYPVTQRTGLALHPPGWPALIALERRWSPETGSPWRLGFVYRVDDSLILRAGLVGKHPAAGGSLTHRVSGRRLSFRYAYYPDEFDVRGAWSVGLGLEL